jgi:hypothetical protein
MRTLQSLFATAGMLLAPLVWADTVVSSNDGLVNPADAAFDFSVGDQQIAASCFVDPGLGFPRTLDEVRVLFGAALEQNVEVEVLVYTRDRLTGPPETFVGRATIAASHQPGFLTSVALDTPIRINSAFCIGISTDTVMSIGASRQTPVADRDWVDTGNGAFVAAADNGVGGHFIIRAVTTQVDVPADPDAGATDGGAGSDSGGPDASGSVYVDAITPTRGALDEFVDVELVGGGFEDGWVYRIGPQPLSEVLVRSSSLVVGTLAASTLDPGTYDVIVSDNGQILARLEQGFQVVNGDGAIPPVIDAVFPSQIPFRQTTNLQITGRNFEAATEVRIGGILIPTRTVVSDGIIDVALFGNVLAAPGAFDVNLRNPDGQTATATGALLVIAPAAEDESGCSAARTGLPGPLSTLPALAALALLVTRRRSA